MEIKEIIARKFPHLVDQSSSIRLEDILTQDEKDAAIRNAIENERRFFIYRRTDQNIPIGTIEMDMSKIDWEKRIDREEVLRVANENKHQALWHQEQRDKEKLEEEEKNKLLKSIWNASNFYKFLKHNVELSGRDFIYNSSNEKLIKSICYFLSEDERFETDLGFNLSKGILLRGTSGLGKTFIPKMVSGNEYKPISIYSVIEITAICKEEGFFNPIFKNVLYLDDVGTEETPVKHYGTNINWVKDFIEMYYLKAEKFNRLIISTNHSFDELEFKYGFRFRSRIKEMFNIVDVQGKDFRG